MGKSGKSDYQMPAIVGAMPGSDLDLGLLKSLEDPPAHGGGGGGLPSSQMMRPNIPPGLPTGMPPTSSMPQQPPSGYPQAGGQGGYPAGGPGNGGDNGFVGGPPMPHLQQAQGIPGPGGVIVPPASMGVPTREPHSTVGQIDREDPVQLLMAAKRQEQEYAQMMQRRQQQAEMLQQTQQAGEFSSGETPSYSASFFERHQKTALYGGIAIMAVVGYLYFRRRASSAATGGARYAYSAY